MSHTGTVSLRNTVEGGTSHLHLPAKGSRKFDLQKPWPTASPHLTLLLSSMIPDRVDAARNLLKGTRTARGSVQSQSRTTNLTQLIGESTVWTGFRH